MHGQHPHHLPLTEPVSTARNRSHCTAAVSVSILFVGEAPRPACSVVKGSQSQSWDRMALPPPDQRRGSRNCLSQLRHEMRANPPDEVCPGCRGERDSGADSRQHFPTLWSLTGRVLHVFVRARCGRGAGDLDGPAMQGTDEAGRCRASDPGCLHLDVTGRLALRWVRFVLRAVSGST